MFEGPLGFLAGYVTRAQCGAIPCAASLKSGSTARPFKLSIVLHSATVQQISRPGMVQVTDKRPYVCVRVGERSKETELGDWNKDTERWGFREVLTLEVVPSDEVSVAAYCSTKYDFLLASVQLTSSKVGEACFPVSSVLPRLQPEDRDTDGMLWSTPVIPFDVLQDGNATATVYLSFETTQAPPSSTRGFTAGDGGGCCATNKHWGADSENADRPLGGPSKERGMMKE